MFNNLSYIAKNITYINEVVTATKFPIVTSQRLHYATIGAVDACAYIAKGQLRSHDLADAILSVESRLISVGIASVPANGQRLFGNDVDEFVCFVMQMEALIFYLDTKVADHDIVRSVISMRSTIEAAIRDASLRVRKRGWPRKWSRNTHTLLAMPTFIDFIHQVDHELRDRDARVERS